MRLSRRTLALSTMGLGLAAPAVRAQSAWPSERPIRLVVGFPPGGSGDFLARIFAESLSRRLEQAIVVENRPGAGSNIAADHVARSAPDGYTILLAGNFTHAVNPALYASIPFDPINDFTPITRLTDLPTIIAVSPQTGIETLAQLIERVRAEPGRWNYATPGNGTPSHLAGAMLSRVANVQLTQVPFRGGGPSLQAVLAGDVQILIGTPPVALPPIRSGQLRAISLTTREPSPVIPGIPGTGEAGLGDLDIAGWWGFWGPAGLPTPIRDRIFEVSVATVRDQAVQERIAAQGLQALPSESPEAFGQFVREQIPFWAEVVRIAGARAE